MDCHKLKEKLEKNCCHIHGDAAYLTVLESNTIEMKTCCLLFRHQLLLMAGEDDSLIATSWFAKEIAISYRIVHSSSSHSLRTILCFLSTDPVKSYLLIWLVILLRTTSLSIALIVHLWTSRFKTLHFFLDAFNCSEFQKVTIKRKNP